MDYIRQKVSGKKKRFQEEGYNLDLTYITSRIIAMSFPGEGLVGYYRNPIEQVAALLNKNHDQNYFVFNLCGIKYDYSKFNNQVMDFPWEDHHSPPLETLFTVCQQIHALLSKQKETVVAIHCLAGKGRTGTAICCYLLYCGRFQNVEDVLKYYSKKRFEASGLGVNQPCQIRYVYYFYTLLNGEKLYPVTIGLKRIKLIGKAPDFNMGGGCKPYVEIISVRDQKLLYTSKIKDSEIKKFSSGSVQYIIDIKSFFQIQGDVLFNFKNIGMIKENKMFRISINTSFLNEQYVILGVNELDPSQLATDDRFDKSFKVAIEYENCKEQNCNNKTHFDYKCESCRGQLSQEMQRWNDIHLILNQHQRPNVEQSKHIIWKDPSKDDVDKILSYETKNQQDKDQIDNEVRQSSQSIPIIQKQ